MTDIKETMETTEEIVTRKNDFCVISLECNENGWYDIQTNSAWSSNPYGDGYAEVLDELVEGAMSTYGYLNPVFNEDRTKMIDFTPAEIPVFETPEPEPTEEELQWQAITDLEISYMELEDKVLNA